MACPGVRSVAVGSSPTALRRNSKRFESPAAKAAAGAGAFFLREVDFFFGFFITASFSMSPSSIQRSGAI
jgi:hypothetical protein